MPGRDRVPAWVRAVSLQDALCFHTARLFVEDAAGVGINEVPSGVRDWTLHVSGSERAIPVLATHLIRKAGYTHRTAKTGAVTLIQRFGGALNLNEQS